MKRIISSVFEEYKYYDNLLQLSWLLDPIHGKS